MLSSSSAISSVTSPMQSGNSYSNERPPSGIDVEYASDPASGGFFHADYKKNDNLKQMLDSNKDNLKLEAMKRIISMVAKGRDASDLFPAVVKNVVSKNIEVKKLVYVYLVRYAEEQQDMALLSISTFQRALKDPNQLIRASALRVLSSIRVSMIVPIVMLAIRESSSDMSPYVRKTAAHAIPKLYNLDPEQKEELICVIEKLLSDRTTLVVGSAVMAFEEVCPERVDLIHKNYKKLCNLLVDVDEWGQVIIINMLTRYARTQFTDPNIYDMDTEDVNKPFYDETSEESDSNDKNLKFSKSESLGTKTYSLDLDHRVLLRQTKPLLQSRNASVVMSVAQLYHHVAPRSEVIVVAKALIRLLRSHKEVQSVVLTCIASMSLSRKSIFEQYMKSFFVRTSDPTHIKLLKLEILTNLATETNISIILREFQTYISSSDKDFVAATIQAIGRCAASIDEVTETCLSGLVHLLSNRDEHVVAESVVVIKKLLQTQVTEHFEIISQMAKLLDFITVPAARAAILWLIGEYNDRVPKIAPDVLRKLAKTFIDEEDIVKLQVLNLSVKLFLTNPEQVELLCQYIFTLSRFDQNYDIRDRARFLKQFIFPSNENSILAKSAKKIFLAKKPAPSLESKHKNREQFQLGSLSHYMNMRATGYHNLPDFPEVAPDSSVRFVAVESTVSEVVPKDERQDLLEYKKKSKKNSTTKPFYSESEKSSLYSSVSESSSEDSDSEGEEQVDEKSKIDKKQIENPKVEISEDSEDDSSASSSSGEDDSAETTSGTTESDDDTDTSSESNEQCPPKNANAISKIEQKHVVRPVQKSNLDLLLDLDDIPPMPSNIMTPSLGGFLSPLSASVQSSPYNNGKTIDLISPLYVPVTLSELLNKVNGFGLGITYRFTRAPHLASSNMISIELIFTNHGNSKLKNIELTNKNLPYGMSLNEFAPISELLPKSTMFGTLGIDFNDSTQPANFSIKSSSGISSVSIRPPMGELIRAVTIQDQTYFKTERSKLRGMNEHSCNIKLAKEMFNQQNLKQRIYEIANFAPFYSEQDDIFNFIGQTLSSKSLVLVSIELKADTSDAIVIVNCEKMVIGSMILNELKGSLQCI